MIWHRLILMTSSSPPFSWVTSDEHINLYERGIYDIHLHASICFRPS